MSSVDDASYSCLGRTIKNKATVKEHVLSKRFTSIAEYHWDKILATDKAHGKREHSKEIEEWNLVPATLLSLFSTNASHGQDAW